MPTSGIANTQRSLATRCDPWAQRPTPAAHHDAVDQRDIGLGIALDAAVQLVFLAPERQLRGVVASPALFVDQSDVAAGAEGAPARARDDHARDALVALERIERLGDHAHHRQASGR